MIDEGAAIYPSCAAGITSLIKGGLISWSFFSFTCFIVWPGEFKDSFLQFIDVSCWVGAGITSVIANGFFEFIPDTDRVIMVVIWSMTMAENTLIIREFFYGKTWWIGAI